MFESKLGEAGLLKRIIDAIKELVTDAPFDCGDAGLSLQAMDSSHVALVSLKLDACGFETYRCDRACHLGISMANLAKILKCAGNDDTCTLRHQDDTDTLTIFLDDAKRDKQQECELKLMDLDAEHLGIPEQDYACVVTMPSAEFAKACRDVGSFSDSLNVVATKAGVQFQGKGDSGTHTIRWGQSASSDDDKKVEIQLTEPVNVTFAVKYMIMFTKASSLADTVTLSLSDGVPVAVEYKLTDQDSEYGSLRFYLAPKIEDEDMAADR